MNEMSNPQAASLFERLGGSPGISAIVDDIVALHMENPDIGARFRPYLEQPEKLQTIKRHVRAFLEAGSGGPAQYAGRDMRTTHRGMNISAAEYWSTVDDIMAALGRHGIDEQTQKDVLAICYGLKAEIMHQ